MSLTRRRFNQTLIAGLGLIAAPGAFAALVEGQDWRRVRRPLTADPEDPIQVLEFFSYGCPHCGQLNRVLPPWLDQLPEDVTFRRVPITFGRPEWGHLARLYYALDATGHLEALDEAVFKAIHEQGRALSSAQAVKDWVAEQEVDTGDFEAVFEAASTRARVARGDRLQSRLGVNSVPTLVVDGRYQVLGKRATRYQDLLEITDELIRRARSRRADAT
ncbi:MAG: thiol:disulfide interchange protein DsbA/DsbL [Ectothiorhodospira sp.]